MYTVPCGHNPTGELILTLRTLTTACCFAVLTEYGLVAGVVTPLARKREIYQICREYNITIIEDDAYFYLQYPTLDGK